MMKYIKLLFLLFSISLILNSCEKETNIDKEKPKIDVSFADAYPVNCDTIYFGEPFDLKILLTDNAELGSFSIGIHHNFDHHSHSTDVAECTMGPVKSPVNPFTFIEDYQIPEGKMEYETTQSIAIPSGNTTGQFDEGDYHFFVSLTDKEGWSAQKGLSIKMFYRK